jgi:hypothetical protein
MAQITDPWPSLRYSSGTPRPISYSRSTTIGMVPLDSRRLFRTRPRLTLTALVPLTLAACEQPTAPTRVTTPPPVEACEPPGLPVRYTVDAAAGADSNPGTSDLPFRTIQQAANVVDGDDTVIVRDGIYTGGNRAIVDIERCGTAAHPIVFLAEHKWGAVLDGRNNTSLTGFYFGASFIRVEGFEIRGVRRYGFDMAEGSVTNLEIAANHIHHVGRYCTDSSGGITAVYVANRNVLIERNLIHDIGRYGPGENGCSPTNNNWQNHDHGLYVAAGSNIVIRNNIFYNILHGWAVHRYSGANLRVDSLFILNNTFAFPNPNKAGQILVSSPTATAVIANNIFYEPLTAGIDFDGAVATNVTVANNLVSTGPAATGDLSGVITQNNLAQVDPLLMDPASLDFHLTTASPAIGAGLTLSGVFDDFDGVLRSAPFDLGAYRFK